MTDESQRVEWGLQIDCALNGCETPHSDDGQVIWRDNLRGKAHTVNGHATVLVRRTITYSAWEPVEHSNQVEHNHVTAVIKPEGECPRCDVYHSRETST